MLRRVIITGLVIGVALPFAVATPAHAAVVVVTTTADVVDGGDGLISLREAVSAASVAAGGTTITLAAATYELSLCGADEDANASGDLDHESAQPLIVDGNGATIEQTCADQRVLEFLGAAPVTLTDVTVTGGESFVGAGIAYRGWLTLDGTVVAGNDAGGGVVVQGTPGLAMPQLHLVGATVGPNTGTGISTSSAPVTITDSTLWRNSGRGAYLVDAALNVVDAIVSQNGRAGLVTTAQGDGFVSISGTRAEDNGGAGITCWACGSLLVTGSYVSGNHPSSSDVGGGVEVTLDQDGPRHPLSVTIEETTIRGNTRRGDGGGLNVTDADVADDAPAAQIVVSRSTIASNGTTHLTGGVGGGVFVESGELRVDNSTLWGNFGSAGGGAIATVGDVHLRHATVYGNFGPKAANISIGGDLYSVASIVSLATPGVDECVIDGVTVSAGYNVGGDGTCGFSGIGDQNVVGDAQLFSLADNGGPTWTARPKPASPALNAVPAPACTVLVVDQRLLNRPQGRACEAGSVELA